MNDNTEALPPLPEPKTLSRGDEDGAIQLGYTAEQMQAYARAALAQRQQVPQADNDLRAALAKLIEVYDAMGNPRGPARILAESALTAAPSAQAEPVAWMWQHDEGGRTGFVDVWQVENGWQERNPRLKLIRPLYAAPPVAQAEPSEDIQQAMAPSRFALYACDQQAAQAEPQVPPGREDMNAISRRIVELADRADDRRARLGLDEPQVPPAWLSSVLGVRVDGDFVVIKAKGGNDAARWICGEILQRGITKEQP